MAAAAQQVRIDTAALREVQPGPPPALDPERHPLELSEADLATYLVTIGAINFGSGWFPTLRKRTVDGRPVSGATTIAWAVTDRFRAHGAWTNGELRAMPAGEREVGRHDLRALVEAEVPEHRHPARELLGEALG